VFERCTADCDIVSELEITRSKVRAAMPGKRVSFFWSASWSAFRRESSGYFLCLDIEFVLAKAGDRHRDAVGVFARALNIVRWITRHVAACPAVIDEEKRRSKPTVKVEGAR